MVSVNELVGQLLLQHNCVVIPGFGGFVASQSSSVIDFSTGTMAPPKKSLLFNKQLINNDGLLISEFSIHNQHTFSEAQEHIQNTIASWNTQLKNGFQIDLPNVGKLFFDKENNISFEQDRFFNLLLQSYGLSKIHFVAEEDVKLVEHKVAIEELVSTPIIEAEAAPIFIHPATKSKVWRYVAAAVMLPIAFYSFWIPIKTDVLESGLISIKDFNPFYKKGEAVYQAQKYDLEKLPIREESLSSLIETLPQNIAVYSYRFDQDSYVAVKVNEHPTELQTQTLPVETSIPEVSAPIKKENTPLVSTGSFSYIVGCFSSAANATNLVAKLQSQGLSASIAGNAGGLTRVSAGSANSQQEIQTIATKAQSLGFSGWVLKN
ncbi:MAG: SPOR domain-containing protein [Bacteroidota bacterium]